MQDLASPTLWHAFGNDGNALDLGILISSIVDWYTDREEAKLTTVSTSLCLATAFSVDW